MDQGAIAVRKKTKEKSKTEIRKETWVGIYRWSLWTVVMSLLPLIVKTIVNVARKQPIDFLDCYSELLFIAFMVSAEAISRLRCSKGNSGLIEEAYEVLAFFCIAISITVFVLTIVHKAEELSITAIRRSAIICVATSLVVGFFTQLVKKHTKEEEASKEDD